MPSLEDWIKDETLSNTSRPESPKLEEVSIPASPEYLSNYETMSNEEFIPGSESSRMSTDSSYLIVSTNSLRTNQLKRKCVVSPQIPNGDEPSLPLQSTRLDILNEDIVEVPNKMQKISDDINILFGNISDNIPSTENAYDTQRPKIKIISDQLIMRPEIVNPAMNRIKKAENKSQLNEESWIKELKSDLKHRSIGNKIKNYKQLLYGEFMDEELKNKSNQLGLEVARLMRLRTLIIESAAEFNDDRYVCKICYKNYLRPGNFINHITQQHSEVLRDLASNEVRSIDNNASTERTDEEISISSHSISSQRTILNRNDSLLLSKHKTNKGESGLKNERTQNFSCSTKIAIPSTSRLRENADSVKQTRLNVNKTFINSSNGSDKYENWKEIPQDSTLWKDLEISIAPRKSIVLLDSKSIELYEKYSRKILMLIKNRNTNGSSMATGKKCNNSYQNLGNEHFHDDDHEALFYCHYMDLFYTKQELSQIGHCFTSKIKSIEPCVECKLKMLENQALQYVKSKVAFEDYEKILNDKNANNYEKKKKLLSIINQDQFKLIRNRLTKVRKERCDLEIIPEIVRYNKTYYEWLQKAFNDKNIQKYVQFNPPDNCRLSFGVYCFKLIDDIVNEFLVHVSVICMNFAYNGRKIRLTKELLRQYRLFFKTTNRDASYLEPSTEDIRSVLKNEYLGNLPNPKEMEVIIIDNLLHNSFDDENLIGADLDTLMFEHLKSPRPLFKFLMYMKFTKDYFEELKILLLEFLFQLSVELLKLKKENYTNNLVTYEELIEACEKVGVFGSSYTYYLKNSYKSYQEKMIIQFENRFNRRWKRSYKKNI